MSCYLNEIQSLNIFSFIYLKINLFFFKVFYVDFGNYEVVPLDLLYHLPFKYVLPKVMAIRLSLNGVDKATETIEMQRAFKQFVDDKLLHMKVIPTSKRVAIPKCELWDLQSKTSALDVLNRAAKHAYPGN